MTPALGPAHGGDDIQLGWSFSPIGFQPWSDLPVDEELDRLLGDADLLYQLQLSGFAPEHWRRPSEEFARYGYDVITGWIFKDRIWREVEAKVRNRFTLRRPARPLDEETVYSLAGDTVVAALEAFLEQVLKKRVWDPQGGASLKTFFIGQCCFQFPNVWRAYMRQQRRYLEEPVADPSELAPASSLPSPEDVLNQEERVSKILEVVSSQKARQAFSLQADGYSEEEIAEIIGVADAKSIENMLGYQRRKATSSRIERNQDRKKGSAG